MVVDVHVVIHVFLVVVFLTPHLLGFENIAPTNQIHLL